MPFEKLEVTICNVCAGEQAKFRCPGVGSSICRESGSLLLLRTSIDD